MRTVGVGCYPFSDRAPEWFENSEEYLKKLSRQGVTAINLNSVYDSGEDPTETPAVFGWCGLPASDWRKPNKKAFPNGMSDVESFVKLAHKHDIAVISWINPSYAKPLPPLRFYSSVS